VVEVHVKGHSADGGNDSADELVQWGRVVGLTVGCGRDTARESHCGAATAMVEPVPVRIGRRGFEAVHATLDVFEEMVAQAVGVSNGV
jgi:hypothetical protein